MQIFRSVYFISGLAAIAGLLFGYDTGVISGAVLFIRRDFGLTPTEVGGVVSAVLLGALVGSAFCGRVTDRLGRRGSLMIASGLFIVASIAAALSESVFDLVMSRLFLGVAIGISSLTAPLYLAEVAPARIRGSLVSLNQLAVTIGILAAFGVNYLFSDSGDWRFMLGLGAAPAAVLGFALLFLPESPRWMVLKGRPDEARKTLEYLKFSGIDEEISAIESSLTNEKIRFRSLFHTHVKSALMIALGLAFFQQATGINAIIYYAPLIFEQVGFPGASHAILATVSVGIINVLFTIISLFLIDRLGRRPLLLIGLAGMGVSLFICGLTFLSDSQEAFRWFALVSVLSYIAFFAISLGPIMWLMIAEVFPLQQRALGTSLAVCAQWAFNLAISASFPVLLHHLGGAHTLWSYTVMCVVGLFFTWRLVPETKGKTLEEIQV
ncbi:MAG: sugar porter family MFS transporter [Myxococcota bacterium]